MEYKLILKKHLFLLFPSIIVGSVVAVSPVQAATFEAFSQTFLTLDNFNQIPQDDVGTKFGIKAKTIAQDGGLIAEIDQEGIFFADSNTPLVFAQADSQVYLVGTGSRYLGSVRLSTQLLGSFLIGANQDFKFDFTASLKLFNATDSLESGGISTSGSVSILLVDHLNQKVFEIFSLSSGLNTNASYQFNRDFLNLRINQNTTLSDGEQQISFGGMKELAFASFTGSFEKSFSQDTPLTLIAVTQTCGYGSNIVSVCARVSEPSNRLALILGLACVVLLPRIMKPIVQFTRQPLIKHFVNNFLIGSRR